MNSPYYPVYVRPHGQLARLFLWALPVDVLIVLLACWLMSGCEQGQPETFTTTVDGVEVRQLPVGYGSRWHQVYFVKSKDGTRCAIYAREGGITCDWNHQ